MNHLKTLEDRLRKDLPDATFFPDYQEDLTKVQFLRVCREGRNVYLEMTQHGFGASINQIWYGSGADVVSKNEEVIHEFTMRALLTEKEYSAFSKTTF